MSGISPGMATIVLLLAFLPAALFVCQHHAHTTALLPAMLTIGLDYPGNEYGSVCPADGHPRWA